MILFITIIFLLIISTVLIMCFFKGKGEDTIDYKCPECGKFTIAKYTCGNSKRCVYHVICVNCDFEDYVIQEGELTDENK